MTDNAKHMIRIKGEHVTAVRERIERVLGVTTTVDPSEPAPYKEWFIYFDAPANVNLDFLRPDVLPPLD